MKFLLVAALCVILVLASPLLVAFMLVATFVDVLIHDGSWFGASNINVRHLRVAAIAGLPFVMIFGIKFCLPWWSIMLLGLGIGNLLMSFLDYPNYPAIRHGYLIGFQFGVIAISIAILPLFEGYVIYAKYSSGPIPTISALFTKAGLPRHAPAPETFFNLSQPSDVGALSNHVIQLHGIEATEISGKYTDTRLYFCGSLQGSVANIGNRVNLWGCFGSNHSDSKWRLPSGTGYAVLEVVNRALNESLFMTWERYKPGYKKRKCSVPQVLPCFAPLAKLPTGDTPGAHQLLADFCYVPIELVSSNRMEFEGATNSLNLLGWQSTRRVVLEP